MADYRRRIRKLVADRFVNDVRLHSMDVKLDNDVHRHLTFSKNGSSILRFSIVTWPGYICICGDMGEYVWARTRDMFSFVRGSIHSEVYFTEKLTAVSEKRGFLEFQHELWEETIEDLLAHFGEVEETRNSLLDLQVNAEPGSFEEACELLDGTGIDDVFEWFSGLQDYSYQYLWCLRALQFAVETYDAEVARGVVEGQ